MWLTKEIHVILRGFSFLRGMDYLVTGCSEAVRYKENNRAHSCISRLLIYCHKLIHLWNPFLKAKLVQNPLHYFLILQND